MHYPIESSRPVKLVCHFEIQIAPTIGQCRAIPVDLGDGRQAVLAIHGADFDVDPYTEMFYFPTDTLKMTLVSHDGKVIWRRDLGKGVVPGMWFCPVFPFDLDGDGIDEIWFVNNADPKHPLSHRNYRLERVDAHTGEATGQWPWPPNNRLQSLSHAFRNFIIGGYVRGEPVLVTCQGTYEDLHFQAWRPDMSSRWSKTILTTDPGARGSHMCPIVDLDGDGNDELIWGERCIEFDTGLERFCADRDVYKGHSDVIAPLRDLDSGKWFLFTIRESDPKATPRVALFDHEGKRVWGAVDKGHMDIGWVARLGDKGRHVAMAIRISKKTCGPDGRFHQGGEKFVFDALTGEPIQIPFSTYRTVLVDINGDGYHELVRTNDNDEQELIDRHGRKLGGLKGGVVMNSKFMDRPGEQLLTASEDGYLRLYYDANAEDCPMAKERYSLPAYQRCRRLGSSGSNANVLGGL